MTEFSTEIIFKNESFLDGGSHLDWQDENSIKKCGEIILLANTNFWFVCTFCDERFHSIVIFRNHIKGQHIDVGNVLYTQDENPLDVHSIENKIIIKSKTDGRDGNCNIHVESSNYLISKPNCGKASEEYEFHDDNTLGDCGNKVEGLVIKNQSDIIKIQTDEIEKCTVKHNSIQSISETVNENAKCNRTNKAFVCKDIEDVLTTSKKTPKKRNRKKKIHSCPNCPHIARDKKSLEAHLQTNHGTGTRHQCEECGKCFRSGNNLRSHLIIHSGTRPYKCDLCDSDFAHYNSLKMHRYIHTGNRPHKCNQCDKGFVSTSGLKTHLREHTGEIPYVCQFCERGFASQCSYKRHMISHSGQRAYECQQCKKAFIHKETLTKHMACHSNEKKFVCDVCSKKFNHKKNLVQHQKLHLNIKQYICKICSKDFAQYAGLYSHMKYHKKKRLDGSVVLFE